MDAQPRCAVYLRPLPAFPVLLISSEPRFESSSTSIVGILLPSPSRRLLPLFLPSSRRRTDAATAAAAIASPSRLRDRHLALFLPICLRRCRLFEILSTLRRHSLHSSPPHSSLPPSPSPSRLRDRHLALFLPICLRRCRLFEILSTLRRHSLHSSPPHSSLPPSPSP